jgi:hypothetical protein
VLLASVLCLISVYGAIYYEHIVFIVNNPIFLPVAILLGGLLYWLRFKRRVEYGVIEIFVAIAAIWVAIISSESPTDDLMARATAIFAGVYIMVRGLDNIEQGLKGERQARWRRFFERTPIKGERIRRILLRRILLPMTWMIVSLFVPKR